MDYAITTAGTTSVNALLSAVGADAAELKAVWLSYPTATFVTAAHFGDDLEVAEGTATLRTYTAENCMCDALYTVVGELRMATECTCTFGHEGGYQLSTILGDACNKDQEMPLLQAINAYNELYVMSCTWEMLGGGDVYYKGRSLHDTFSKMGVAGFPLGTFARDVTRVVTDENGAEHTLVAAKGTKAIMVPSADGTARAEMEVSKVRPYIGFGYNTHLSRNKRWRLNVDAGVMFLCGAPKVYVDNVYSIDESLIDTGNEVYDIVRPNEEGTDYVVDTPLSHIDLVRDLQGITGKVGDLVDVASKFKVYPNATVTFSYRLY